MNTPAPGVVSARMRGHLWVVRYTGPAIAAEYRTINQAKGHIPLGEASDPIDGSHVITYQLNLPEKP